MEVKDKNQLVGLMNKIFTDGRYIACPEVVFTLFSLLTKTILLGIVYSNVQIFSKKGGTKL